jgi:predicted TIM-barrel fold metal-dependent hydrolase
MTMRIIDTHLHLIYLDKFSYPWLDGNALLKRQWDAPSYWAEAAPLGIEAALHMEVDVAEPEIEDETRFVLGLDPRVVGAISNARPEHIDFPAHLERMLAEPRIRAIRRLLQSDPDDLSAGEVFRGNVRRLATSGLVFDITVQSRQLPVARALAAACPDVQFVLDHCGNPLIAGGDISQWRTDLRAIADLPNVACKVSGIVSHAKPGWTAADLRPAVEHVIECFGWNRVVFGSDRPVLTLNGSLKAWVEALKEIVSAEDVANQQKLFSKNAERIYRLA